MADYDYWNRAAANILPAPEELEAKLPVWAAV